MGGFLKEGTWTTKETWESSDEDGSFQRQESQFREHIRDEPGATFTPDANRYHLYVSYACPWACRVLMMRALKGLDEVLPFSVVHPFMGDDGWHFGTDFPGATGDLLFEAEFAHQIYTRADANYSGRVTVPILWDRETHTIVNNESREIIRMLDVAFDELATRDVDLYPEGYRDAIEEAIDAIYQPINNGVYRCGFAGTQQAYERAFGELFEALDHWEEVLSKQRYLCGDVLTEADICMFTTLVRFDAVYYVHFKCNGRHIWEYPNLWGYLRELYQLPGVAETVNMEHIKHHYYSSHESVNPKRFVPVGPLDLDFDSPHGRGELPGGPPAALAG